MILLNSFESRRNYMVFNSKAGRLLFFILTWINGSIYAQDRMEEWSLHKCITYALDNNLSLKSNDLDARAAALTATYSKYGYLPDLSMAVNYGENFGRTINPTTNQFDNTRFSSIGLNAGANVLLFGWFQKRHAVYNNILKSQSAVLMTEQSRYEICLTIATAYLRVLMAAEQASSLNYQITTSIANKERIKKLKESGKSNMLEYSQSATQLASDSSAYFQALLNEQQALIDLKAILNLPFDNQIKLKKPENIPAGLLEIPDPELIYEMAIKHMPSVKGTELASAIAEKEVVIAQTSLLPQLSAYASSGTNYSSSFYEYSPDGTQKLINFGRQFQNNFSQSVGVSLSIPLFNKFSARQGIANAKLARQKTKINQEQTFQKLKQDIYRACQDYLLSQELYATARSAEDNAELAFNAATIRFENGLVSYFEYTSTKDNFLKLQNEAIARKYDLYFKMLVIQYYKSARAGLEIF